MYNSTYTECTSCGARISLNGDEYWQIDSYDVACMDCVLSDPADISIADDNKITIDTIFGEEILHMAITSTDSILKGVHIAASITNDKCAYADLTLTDSDMTILKLHGINETHFMQALKEIIGVL